MAVRFIPEEVVLIIHKDQIRRYGGRLGVRDRNLLNSAVAQPKMTSGGRYLHTTLFDKAAAYGFHLCRNHSFIDGNKRVAFLVMLLFLHRNGWELTASEEDAYATIIALAEGTMTKPQLSSWLKAHTARSSK